MRGDSFTRFVYDPEEFWTMIYCIFIPAFSITLDILAWCSGQP